MGILDKLLAAIKLNDDYDEDEYMDDDLLDDEEDFLDDEDEEDKPRKKFFDKFTKKKSIDDEEEDFLDDEDEQEKNAPKFTASKSTASDPLSAPKTTVKAPRASTSKITPMRSSKRTSSGGVSMEVCVIKPSSMEDAREIADTLVQGATVILNLEGIDVELAQRIRKGDQRALEKLTRANLRFVVSVAKQYQNQGLSLPDLINEGNLGLIKAAEKFDETRGFKFISYAVWWIRQSILQALAEQSRIVRLPLNQVGSLNKINKALSKFEQENERQPSSEELSEMIDVPKDKISDTLRVSGRHVSVDAPFVEGEDNSLLDVLPNDDSPCADRGLVNESLNTEIERALATLTTREREIIKSFFGIGCQEMTLEEIGERFGLTRERVRQIKEKAIRRLKSPSRSKLLKGYLG